MPLPPKQCQEHFDKVPSLGSIQYNENCINRGDVILQNLSKFQSLAVVRIWGEVKRCSCWMMTFLGQNKNADPWEAVLTTIAKPSI